MLLPFLTTATTWTGPLMCDPSMQAALRQLGDDAAMREARAYYDTGEIGVQVPDDVTRITLRPLSAAQREAAQLAAGPLELFGERVDTERAAYLVERTAHHAAQRVAEGEGQDAAGAVDAGAIDDTLRWLDQLDDERRQAWQRFEARQRRLMLERVVRGLVVVEGWPDPPAGQQRGPDWWRSCVESLPAAFRRSFVLEAATHLQRVGALRPMGKAPSGPRSGGAGPTPLGPPAGGAATSAPRTTTSGASGDAAGGR